MLQNNIIKETNDIIYYMFLDPASKYEPESFWVTFTKRDKKSDICESFQLLLNVNEIEKTIVKLEKILLYKHEYLDNK